MAPTKNEFRPDFAVPPGWVLEERLDVSGISHAEFARRCGRSPKLISEIIAGKAPLSLRRHWNSRRCWEWMPASGLASKTSTNFVVLGLAKRPLRMNTRVDPSARADRIALESVFYAGRPSHNCRPTKRRRHV
jgi:hypothetical protein